MGYCCYCKKKESRHKTTHFFKFPEKHHTEWVVNMGWQNWTPNKSSTLCSDHFTKDSFDYRDQRARLRKGAVPTIFRSSVNDHKLLGGQIFHCNVETPSSSSDVQAVLSPCSEVHALSSLTATQILPSSPAATQKLLCLSKENVTPKSHMHMKRLLQHDHHYVDTPTILRKKLNAALKRISKIQVEQKLLKQQVKRSKITIQTMKSVIKELRQQKMVSDTGLYSLERFKTKPAHLFTHMIVNTTKSKLCRKKKSPELKHTYSRQQQVF